MDASEYNQALATLNLHPSDVCAWLGVSERCERNWRKGGVPSAASEAFRLAILFDMNKNDLIRK